ncbi:MAG TPA: LpqB family beta-propeller domain-containing protein [Ktedonobacteraceae bacterium]|nr:LpqB family beta-propeller domain-containing protein [Ktedonobacteraceae bacterium]
MATTKDPESLEANQAETQRPPLGGTRFDWIVTILCIGLVGGAFLDGWAHAHGKVDNTFFTPWHAVLYSCFALVGAFLFVSWLRNRRKGYPWRDALPFGYGVSLLGAFIFGIGGVLDLIWHTLFGIEVSIDRLLSPTHLLLGLGFVLIVSGPLRAAWARFPGTAGYGRLELLPAVVSVTLLLSTFTFFTEYAHPLVYTWAASTVHATANIPADLYVMNADGSSQIRLTSTPLDRSSPDWSRDGRQIAFAGGTQNNQQIYVANADGSNATQITHDTFDNGGPSWSPDGRKIVFSSNRDGTYQLYITNADGSGIVRVTHDAAFDGRPSWSPDGSKLVFISDRAGIDDVYVMNVDGSNVTRLTHEHDYAWDPSWSPDGSKLVFFAGVGNHSQIFVMNADGSSQVQVTSTSDANNWAPSWSPDGTRIAFASNRTGNSEIYVTNANGSSQLNISNNPGADNGDNGTSWSWVSNKIVYTSQGHPAVDTYFSQSLGITSILFQATLLMALVLLLLRRWMLPFGSLTLIFTLNAALMSVLADQYPLILAALLAGVIADVLMWWLKPSATRPVEFRLVAFLIPVAFYGLYFLDLLLTNGVAWSVNLWMGSIVLSGVIGLLLSYLLVPPITGAKEPARPGSNEPQTSEQTSEENYVAN